MAQQDIKLGQTTIEQVTKIQENFTELYNTDSSHEERFTENETAVEGINSRLSTVESNYITKAVSDLANYYTKTQTDSKITALQNQISQIPKFSISVVSALPTSNISTTTIYLVPNTNNQTSNIYTEYIYVNSKWEIIGTQTLDLSGYALKTEIPTSVNGLTGGAIAGNVRIEGSLLVEGNSDKSTHIDFQVSDDAEDISTLTATQNDLFYNDNRLLTDDDLPNVNDGKLTIQKNGTAVATFTANQGTDVTANIEVPTASTTAPKMDGTAAIGSSSNYAKADHVHPTDTSRASTAVATTSSNGLMSAADKKILNSFNEAGALRFYVTVAANDSNYTAITINGSTYYGYPIGDDTTSYDITGVWNSDGYGIVYQEYRYNSSNYVVVASKMALKITYIVRYSNY